MYDYFLGGKDHYQVDREAAEQALAAAPEIRALARENRAFLQRAVRFLAAEAGIRQFIDLGTGLPTKGNVHEVAQQAVPDARVVYVDYDPVATTHARALLATDDQTVAIQADLRDPEAILGDPHAQELIDFDQPVAVLFLSVLHFVTDEEDPAGIVARFREAMAPGSYVALSHGSARNPQRAEEAERGWDRATSSIKARTSEQVRALFEGFDLVEPGLVNAAEWRPDSPGKAKTHEVGLFLAGVGRKP